MGYLKISVIIPTYNAERTVGNCLRSVIDQNYPNLEVILIDGISNDSTIKIIGEFATKYSWIKFMSEKDEGIYDAMNKGLRIATGDWLLFLGSDDTFYDSAVLSDVCRKLEQTKDVDALYGDAIIIGNTSWSRDGDRYDGEFTLPKIVSKNICHQTIFYKNDFLRRVGEFNISYKLCADWDLNLRCWAMGKLFYFNRIIVNFNAGGESTKNSVDTLFSKDFVKNVMLYFDFDPFHKIFQTPFFPRRDELDLLQRKRNVLRWSLNRVLKGLINGREK